MCRPRSFLLVGCLSHHSINRGTGKGGDKNQSIWLYLLNLLVFKFIMRAQLHYPLLLIETLAPFHHWIVYSRPTSLFYLSTMVLYHLFHHWTRSGLECHIPDLANTGSSSSFYLFKPFHTRDTCLGKCSLCVLALLRSPSRHFPLHDSLALKKFSIWTTSSQVLRSLSSDLFVELRYM